MQVWQLQEPFAMITNLSELYIRFRRFILLVQIKKVISMIYGNCVPKLMRNSYRKKSHSNLRKKISEEEYLFFFFSKKFPTAISKMKIVFWLFH